MLQGMIVSHIVRLTAVSFDHIKAVGIIRIEFKFRGLLRSGGPAQLDMSFQLGNRKTQQLFEKSKGMSHLMKSVLLHHGKANGSILGGLVIGMFFTGCAGGLN